MHRLVDQKDKQASTPGKGQAPIIVTLVDTTGRIQRTDKRGFISDKHLPILERLGIDSNEWMNNTENFEKLFYQKFHYRRRSREVA